jgi:hypothetical protein
MRQLLRLATVLAFKPAAVHGGSGTAQCLSHPTGWQPSASWANASYCPKLHRISCGVYDPSGCIHITLPNGTELYITMPDGAFGTNNSRPHHYVSTDLLRWQARPVSWFSGLTGGVTRTPSGFYGTMADHARHTIVIKALPADVAAGELPLDRWNCSAAKRTKFNYEGCGTLMDGFAGEDVGRGLTLPGDNKTWFLPGAVPHREQAQDGGCAIQLGRLQGDDLSRLSGEPTLLYRWNTSLGFKDYRGVYNASRQPATGDAECPDVFLMSQPWSEEYMVAIVGIHAGGLGLAGGAASLTNEWAVGNLDSSGRNELVVMSRGLLDYGSYYSGKSSGHDLNPTSGRRIVHGWALAGPVTPPWMDVCGHHQTFPRELSLGNNGLEVHPIAEIASMYTGPAMLATDSSTALVVGSQAELRLRCSYRLGSGTPFGVDVLRSMSGDEQLRVAFEPRNGSMVASPGSLIVDHALAWSGGVSVPSSRHPFPAGVNASEQVSGARQNAPVPSNNGAVTCNSVHCDINITVLLDGGLIESFVGGVALTSFASPSTLIVPTARVASLFGVGRDTKCELHGRRLSLKTTDGIENGSTHYVASNGADSNNGLSASTPWKTLAHANKTALLPGDRLLLRCGDTWPEMLHLNAQGAPGRPVRIASYGCSRGAGRPLIQRGNKSTDIAMLLDGASYVNVDGLAFSTAKIGLYLRYWQSYGHRSVSVTNCTFENIDDPEFDPYAMAKRGQFPSRDVSWSSGIMVGGTLSSLNEPGTVLTGFNVTHCLFTSVAVGVQIAIGDWSSPSGPPGSTPPPFGRVESVFLSDLTQTGALQGIAALNYVINARLTRLNTKKGGGQRVHLPAGTAGGFLWFCQNVQIDHSRFGHERRVAPTPDGEGIDLEGGNDNIVFEHNVLDFNWGPAMLVMDHGVGSNNSNVWVQDSTFVGNGEQPQCCSSPKPAYCGSQQCEPKQLSWNNPWIVASGVRRTGFYSAKNTTTFGPPGTSRPSHVADLRIGTVNSVTSRPVSWNFATRGQQGWTSHSVAARMAGGKLSAHVKGSEAWLQSPLTWINPFDTPLINVMLTVSANLPARICLAWLTEADQRWDPCEQAMGRAVKVLPLELATGNNTSAVDMRNSQQWGGIITSLRLVVQPSAGEVVSMGLASVVPVAGRPSLKLDDNEASYDLLISRMDAASLSAWTFSNGAEFPGSSGNLTARSATADQLMLSYNFTNQTSNVRGYVAAEFFHGGSLLAAVSQPTALAVELAGAAADMYIRVIDASGQSHLGNHHHNASSNSVPLVVPLTKVALPTTYGGAADGVLHFPLTEIAIGVENRGRQVGTLLLSNLSLHTLVPPTSPLVVATAPVAPFGIVFADEVQTMGGLQVRVNVSNLLRTSCPLALAFAPIAVASRTQPSPFADILIDCGQPAFAPPPNVDGWATKSCLCTLTLGYDRPNGLTTGYYPFQLTVKSSGQCSPRVLVPPIESAIVVLDRSHQPQPVASRVFGSQFFDSAMAGAAARIGIAHTRIQTYWRWMQRLGPTEEPDWNSGGFQSNIAGALDSGISVTLDLRSGPPDWAIGSNGSKSDRVPPWSMYPKPEHLQHYVRFLKSVLLKCCDIGKVHQSSIAHAISQGGDMFSLEVGNEPDSLVYWASPQTPLHLAVKLYVDTIQAVENATLAACPAMIDSISGLSISGDDGWLAHGWNFTRAAVKELQQRVPGALSSISPHPYARQHYLPTVLAPWGNASWTMPEDNLPLGLGGQAPLVDELWQLAAIVAPLRHRSKPLQQSPTEFGYGLSQNESAGSVWAREHGAAIAQSCIMLRTAPLVDRFFLFSATYPGLETGTSYGIWRNGQPGNVKASGVYPLPAAAAFATAARMTDQPTSKFLHRLDVSGIAIPNVTALAFTNGARAVVIVWTRGSFKGMNRNRELSFLPIRMVSSSLPANTTVTRGTGEGVPRATDGSFQMTLEAMPTYFECDVTDLMQLEAAVRRGLASTKPTPLSVKPFGLKSDDTEGPVMLQLTECTNHSDCTEELQAALDSSASLVDVAPLADGRPWIVRPIHIRSDTTVLFRPGCHVQAKRFSFHGITDSLINIRDAYNVTVLAHGATFSMWKNDYTNTSLGYSAAQWRHGFWVSGKASALAGGIRVEGAFVTRTGGDGMQIEANGVTVKHFHAHDNFRQGISILGGRDLVIEDSVFSNTSGHAPGSGLQIEPWHSQNVVENVSIRRCRALYNQGNGFCVAIGALNGSSAATSVEISDCTAVGSIAGVAITSPLPSVRGHVTVRNITARHTKCWGVLVYNHAAGGNHTVRITDSTFDGDATIVDGRGCGLTAPIGVGYVTWQQAPRGPVGGISVDRSRVIDNVNRSFLLATAPSAKYARSPYGIKDVHVSVSREGKYARSGCNARLQPLVVSNVSVHCHAGESTSQRPLGLKSDDTDTRGTTRYVCM